jgi:hypothetical protein
MSTHHDVEFLYRQKLSRPMADLLADPFSELTRKYHNALLITATITLLLSARLVSVTEVGCPYRKVRLSFFSYTYRHPVLTVNLSSYTITLR